MEDSDAQLAASLQVVEDRLAKESAAMLSTLQGKAYKFTEMVLNECGRIEKQQPSHGFDIRPVAVDDMVFQAEALLFLDGREGLAFHVLQGFWYRFLVDAKLSETRAYMDRTGCDAPTAIHAVLGIDVS